MPFPLSKVRSLADYDGNCSLSITCRSCQHSRVISAATLAKMTGGRGLVSKVVKHLRCHKCQAHDPDVLVVGIPR